MNIENILIKTKRDVFSKLNGVFSSRNLGEGFDFANLREYDYQSDARKIDWLAFAKTRELYQKEYNVESSRNISILTIVTGSLFFGYSKLLYEISLQIASLLAFSALFSKDLLRFGYIDEKRLYLKYINSYPMLEREIRNLGALDIIGKDFKFDFNDLFYRLSQKNLVILIGDFLYPVDLNLLSKKHEVVCVVIRNRLKIQKDNFEFKDNITSNKKSSSLGEKEVRFYEKKTKEILLKNYLHFNKNKIDYLEIDENEDLFYKLSLFFGNR